jgi:hypothetical protein
MTSTLGMVLWKRYITSSARYFQPLFGKEAPLAHKEQQIVDIILALPTCIKYKSTVFFSFKSNIRWHLRNQTQCILVHDKTGTGCCQKLT